MPERKAGDAIRKILVGVDGSEKSISALKWAVELASQNGAHIYVLSAWQTPFPSVELIAIGLNLDITQLNERPSRIAQYRLDKVVHAVYGKTNPDGATCFIEEGYPGLILVEKSKEMDLLVLGNRGHSPIVETFLGSVSLHCLAHAHCPVVIVKE